MAGPYGGSFSILLGLEGHGGATTGSLTATDLHTLLKNFVGQGDSSAVGDTVLSGTSASQFTDNGTLSCSSNNLIRVGDRDDGRGNGQYVAVNAAATVTLLTAMDATPNASDQIYVAQMLYPDERPGSLGSITSTRWQLQSANMQFRCYGCFPMSMEFSGLNHGEIPQVRLTYGVSYYISSTNQTFPDATATDSKTLAPITMGSVFVNDVGTTTRTTYSLRSWNLNMNMNTVPLMGPGAINEGQIITGAVRERCSASLSMQFDAEASGTETWGDKWDAGTNQHILLSLHTGQSTQDGKALGFYFNNARMVGKRPTQTNADGLNRVDTEWEALTNASGSTAVTLASWRLALG